MANYKRKTYKKKVVKKSPYKVVERIRYKGERKITTKVKYFDGGGSALSSHKFNGSMNSSSSMYQKKGKKWALITKTVGGKYYRKKRSTPKNMLSKIL